jgi:formylglycine-generating enzyme required for sulfatase activity
MHGNVGEWCQDLYDPQYYATSPVVDPAGPAETAGNEKQARIYRGGSWQEGATWLRSATRGHTTVGAAGCVGFRVVLEIPPASEKTPIDEGR